ncbi:MAG: MFS transporter [Patescibacteria group bacterium]|nr:MFS transporter [Patescibacteria group bacterium]
MNKKIKLFLRNFLPYRMSRQTKELFVSNIIINLALAMVQLYEPIYLFKLGYQIYEIIIFYLLVYVLYFFALPLGAKFANKYGYENGMFLGSVLYIPFYLSLFLITKFSFMFFLAIVFYVLQKMFYWPAYHGNFSHNSVGKEEGREISSASISSSLMFIFGPIIGGVLIQYFGFAVLFIIASILFLVSNIPMLLTRETFTKRDFRYSFIFKDIFKKSNLKALFSTIGYAEELVLFVVWPIFMIFIIDSYEKIGFLSGTSSFIMLLSTLYIGRLCDKRDKKVILRLSSFFYVFTWVAKIFVRSIFPIFVFDTFSKTAKSGIDVSMRSIVYEDARTDYREQKDENDNSIMERCINYESGLVLGKIFACFAVLGLSLVFLLPSQLNQFFMYSFIFSAIMSFFYALL